MKEQLGESPQYKTSPKVSFILGILAGITVTSLLAFIMTFALLRSAFNGTNANEANNNAKVAGAAVNTNTQPTQPTDTNTAPPAPVDIKIASDDHIKGDKNAKVTLVEYSDFQCPFCQRNVATIDKILADYKGQVRLIFRQFPLTSLHQYAQKAAEASECVAELGGNDKFWEYHDKIFEKQSELSLDNLKQWAKDIGINSSKFNDCLDSGKYTKKVQDSTNEGSQYGVEGTPATFVNGILVSGAQPYENFKSVIDSLLK